MSASIDRETVGSGLLEQTGYRAGRLLGRAELLVRRLPTPRPWMVLGALVLASWGIAAEVGRIAQHDGWYYDDGGDDSGYYTTAWAIAHGHLPLARIGYGYSLLLAPFARAAGPDVIDGLPSIIFLNQLVLAPVALLCIYGITRSFASRRYAYAVTLLWVVFPVAVIHYFLPDYHSRYVDVTLPSALGLTALGDFPSMVVLLVSAYFTVRLISTHADLDAVAAGLAAGVAITIKPANLLYLPAPAIALAVARRPRGLAVFAAALVPALIGLTLWKWRGLGYLPVLHNAAGAAPLAVVAPLAFAGLNVHKYLQFNWSQLQHNLDGLREYTWSQRMIYFTAIGGFVGLARRALAVAGLAGAWIGSYLLVKGSSTTTDLAGGDFFTHMIAAFPGYFLLVVSLPFLIPIYGRRRPPAPVTPSSRRLPLVTCGLLGAVTLIGIVVVASLPQLTAPAAAEFQAADLYLPLNAFPLSARTTGRTVSLSWPLRPPAGTRASFALFRDTQDQAVCTPQGNGATECDFDGTQVAATAGSASVITDRPAPGRWTYRVALSATPFGPQAPSDYVLVSTPVTVVVRPVSGSH